MNCFRMTPDRSLDREYLRVAAVYRCLSRYGASKAEALALSNRPIRGVYKKPDWLMATIELWLSGPLRKRTA